MIQIVNPLDYSAWDKWIGTDADSTVFQGSSWARTIVTTYHFKPCYFILTDHDHISAAIPVMEVKSLITGKRGVSLPFSDSCEPIIKSEANLDTLLETILLHGRKSGWKYLEIRGGGEAFQGRFPAFSYCFEHVIPLNSPQEIMFSSFKESTRRSIRKASKEGLMIEITASSDALRTFVRLNELTRRRHGLPPQPSAFFKRLYESFFIFQKGFVCQASYKNNVIASSVYLTHNKKAYYKYGASDMNYQHLRPNNLVMWEAVKHLAKKGFEELSLGRSEPHHEGLLRFKNGFSSHVKKVYYYRHYFEPGRWVQHSVDTGAQSLGVFSKMPIWFLRGIGIMLYKHVA